MSLRIRYLAVPFSSHITSTSSFSSSLDGSKLSHTDWSQPKKVTDDNYSWALGSSLLPFWSNIQIVGRSLSRSEGLCQRRALQRSQQDVRERKTSVDVLRGRGVPVDSERELGNLHSGPIDRYLSRIRGCWICACKQLGGT